MQWDSWHNYWVGGKECEIVGLVFISIRSGDLAQSVIAPHMINMSCYPYDLQLYIQDLCTALLPVPMQGIQFVAPRSVKAVQAVLSHYQQLRQAWHVLLASGGTNMYAQAYRVLFLIPTDKIMNFNPLFHCIQTCLHTHFSFPSPVVITTDTIIPGLG